MPESIPPALPYILVGVLTLVSFASFFRPLRLVVKLVFHTVLGFLSLLLYNWAGAPLGLSVGINLYTSLTVALLGPWGLILLIVLQWFLGT